MSNLNDIFFTPAANQELTYDQVLEDVQRYFAENHASTIAEAGEGNAERATSLLKELMEHYIVKRKYALDGLSTKELCSKLYEDMAGYSFLKKWIYKPGVEEVNINAYNDIEVIESSGRSIKIPDKFSSPQHAIDVIRRMLNACGMVIDDTMPSIVGFLDKNIRISVDKTPIVDADVGVNASIRIVNQQTVSEEKLLNSGSATAEMLHFLTACIRYGVSVCIAGSTGSGKTTIMAWLLSNVPNNRRLITIEEGSREFDLVKRDAQGNILNSVVHLLTRPSENPALNINQDFLLERVLRKHPDVIGVGEMRSAAESLSAAESSRTGHTVCTTIHSNSCNSTYRRMMTLSVKDNIYLPRVFAQEDETARRIAQRLVAQMPVEHIAPVLEQVKVEMGLRLSAQQEAAVYAAFRHGLSVITGSPGTGKTTVLRTILEVYRRLHPDGKIALMAPTGRASRRMSESTGFEDARTLHSGLGLTSEEDEGSRNRKSEPLSADLIIVDEFSMVDMWLAEKFFERMKINARIVLVGDPDQLPSVGAGNVFREIIETKIVPVTVLDQIFRQSKDSLIAYNAKFINEGNTKLFYGPDFVFVSGDSQEDTAEKITERYCLEIQESGIENVQILSPFRSEGAASSEQLNETIRELVNPFRSAEEEIKFGPKIFRINDRIMQTKNTEKVSNGDLGFIRYIKDTDQGKKIGMDFGAGRTLEYGVDDLSNVDLAYATTIHKAMGSEYETVIMPLLKAHTIMMYRNLLYTGITRAKKRVVLIGQKQVLFMAIHRNEIGKRNTLLGMRIQMYFKAYAKKAGIPIPAVLEEQLKNAS